MRKICKNLYAISTITLRVEKKPTFQICLRGSNLRKRASTIS